MPASLISAKEDKERQGKCPWEGRGRDAAPAGGQGTEDVSRGQTTTCQGYKNPPERDLATTLTLKVSNLRELCSNRLQVPGTARTSSQGLVRSYYWGRTTPLLRFASSRTPFPVPFPGSRRVAAAVRSAAATHPQPSPSLATTLRHPPGEAFRRGGSQPSSAGGVGVTVVLP